MKLQIAIVEVVKAGVATHQPRRRDRPDHEDGCGRAMVGALRRVFLNPTAEFAEREDRDPVSRPAAARSS